MVEVLQASLTFPTVIFTALMGFVLLYWTLVLAGGVDLDSLDPHVDAHVDVHVDAHVDAHVDGHVDAHADAHADHGDAEHGGAGFLAGMLSFMNVGSVPVTILASAAILLSWMSCMVLELYGRPALASVLPSAVLGGMFLLGSSAVGLFASALATRPLRGVFKVHSVHEQDALLDQVCTIATTTVTSTFGQATVERKGSPLLLSVRCKTENNLSKGKQAVIVSHDKETDTYIVGELYPDKPKQLSEQVGGSAFQAEDKQDRGLEARATLPPAKNSADKENETA